MRPRHPNGFAGFAENTYWVTSANLSGFLDKKIDTGKSISLYKF